ncbi:MAG: hypothetical protein ACYDC2_12260 [Solirubrobacteraceae bacterium]
MIPPRHVRPEPLGSLGESLHPGSELLGSSEQPGPVLKLAVSLAVTGAPGIVDGAGSTAVSARLSAGLDRLRGAGFAARGRAAAGLVVPEPADAGLAFGGLTTRAAGVVLAFLLDTTNATAVTMAAIAISASATTPATTRRVVWCLSRGATGAVGATGAGAGATGAGSASAALTGARAAEGGSPGLEATGFSAAGGAANVEPQRPQNLDPGVRSAPHCSQRSAHVSCPTIGLSP